MSELSDEKGPGITVEMRIGFKEYNMDVNDLVKSTGLRRKATLNVSFCVKKERNASFKKELVKKRVNDIITQYPLVLKPRKTVLRGVGKQQVVLDEEDPVCTNLPPPLAPQVMAGSQGSELSAPLKPPTLLSPLSPEPLLAATQDPALTAINYDIDLSDISADNSVAEEIGEFQPSELQSVETASLQSLDFYTYQPTEPPPTLSKHRTVLDFHILLLLLYTCININGSVSPGLKGLLDPLPQTPAPGHSSFLDASESPSDTSNTLPSPLKPVPASTSSIFRIPGVLDTGLADTEHPL